MRIDYEKFLRSRVEIRNESGARAYETGLRTFDCPLCGDDKGRGWLGVTRYAAGCFNPGCDAEPQLEGGALEWARRALGLLTRGETWRALEKEFGTEVPVVPEAPRPRSEDWCDLPKSARPFTAPNPLDDSVPPLEAPFAEFVARQWGVDRYEAKRWDLHYAASGRHAWRVIIPITMAGALVGFQARHIQNGIPKYLTSEYGFVGDERAECGRPASALLFNADAIAAGREMLLVEGAGDVMGWHRTERDTPAAGILGIALTPAKIAIIKAARPRRVIVALDAGAREQQRAMAHVEDLQTWGLEAVAASWEGGKDAGSGARLVVGARVDVAAAVRARLSARS